MAAKSSTSAPHASPWLRAGEQMAIAPGTGRLASARWLVRSLSILACIALWQLASTLHVNLGVVTFRNVPSPVEVAQSAVVLLKSPKLAAHISSSLWRVFAGY